LTWGFRFEIQARNNNPGTDGSQLKNNGDNQDNRYQDLYLSGNLGKVSFGKGDGASNGSTEVDMSGTSLTCSGTALWASSRWPCYWPWWNMRFLPAAMKC
jgi:hypothetical protein